MSAELSNALLITALGMGLVFVAILLLWGLMAGLVKLTSRTAGEIETEEEKEQAELDRKRRAAMAAVAVALAKQADTMEPHEFPLPPTAFVSAWQAVLRSKILNKRGSPR